MLLDVGVEARHIGMLPSRWTVDPVVGVRTTATALEELAHLRCGAILLATHRVHPATVGIFVLHGEMIVDVAVVGTGAHLPTAEGERPHRLATHHPVGYVDVVE